jgi:uncharacterized protein GlcG (DUF336 family)
MIRMIGKMAVPVLFALAVQAAVAQALAGQAPGGPGGQNNPQVDPDLVRTDVTTIRSLKYQYSMQAAQAALDACAATDPKVAVVIVDTQGNARLIMVADGAKSSLVENARRKGLAAAQLRQVTSVEQKLIQSNPLLVIPPNSQELIEPGGVPIRAGSVVIGGIGVEGGDPLVAEKCAQAAVDTLNDVLKPQAPQPNGPRPGAQQPVATPAPAK